MPADVEFAFLDGKLVLLQIRPFVESARARSASYLQRLDRGFRERGDRPVDLNGIPVAASPTDTASTAGEGSLGGETRAEGAN